MPTGLQLQSTVRADGNLHISLEDVKTPDLGPDDVLIRVEASPINPSDLGLLLSAADLSQAKVTGPTDRPVFSAPLPESALIGLAARIDKPMPVGNEGTGVVIEAGESDAAKALVGRTVGVIGGEMYAQYRVAKAPSLLILPEGVTAAQGASWFINPTTALGFLETMRRENHTALVHTAAASNLGQMLVKLCQSDGVPLVNIVRRQEHSELLKNLGAEFVVDSSESNFMNSLVDALAETGATLAFDAIGGGSLGSDILTAMERATNRNATSYSRYGSTTHKQLYFYGSLDPSPSVLLRNYGMCWSAGGWLLTALLKSVGRERQNELRQRVANEITTTFASHYTHEISLAEALQLDTVKAYQLKATGQKYLIVPWN